MLLSLPEEILEDLAKFLSGADLKNICCCDASWYETFQPLLWRSLTLRPIDLCQHLSENQLNLLMHVKKLKIIGYGNKDPPTTSDTLSKNFSKLMMNCRNAERLEIQSGCRSWLLRNALKSISYVTNLQELIVHKNVIVYSGGGISCRHQLNNSLDTVSEICMLPLKTLQLSWNGEICDCSLEKISQVLTLEELDITNDYATQWQRTNEGMKHLAILSHLRVLNVSSTYLNDAGVCYMAKLENLRKFIANHCRIKGESMSCLNGLLNLEELSLDGNPITDNGLKELGHLMQLKRLYLHPRSVSLQHKSLSMTDQGIEYLRELKWLHVMHLQFTPVTKEHCARLRSLLPHIRSLKITDSRNGRIHILSNE